MIASVQGTLLRILPGELGGFQLFFAGLMFLFGTAGWYYNEAERPNAWPKVSAVVLSSRIGEAESKESLYEPRIRFEFEHRGIKRSLDAPPLFRSPSFEEVRRHVERYPPGAAVELAVNRDGTEIRYEVGPTRRIWLQTGVLGLVALIITRLGVLRLQSRRMNRAAEVKRVRVAAKWRAAMLVAGGLAAGVLGVSLPIVLRDNPMLDWPAIDAEVVTAGVAPEPIVEQNLPRFDILVKFKYVVGGVPYERETVSGTLSSNSFEARRRLESYVRGSRHQIRHRPGAPDAIVFDVRDRELGYIPVLVMLLSPILVVAGVVMWRKAGE